VEIRLKRKIDKYLGYLLIAVLLPVTRLLGISLPRDHSTRKAPRRILFIKLMGLGSLIVAADAVIALRKQFPDTRFILLTDANITAGMSTLTAMIGFLVRSWSWKGLWVVDLEVYSKLTTVFALLTLARNRFGFYLSPVRFRKFLNTHNILFDQSAPLQENYFSIAREVGGGKRLQIPAATAREGEYQKPFILLNNTCSSLAGVRKLPDALFAEICHWILTHTKYKIALLGSLEDREEVGRFIGGSPTLLRNRSRIVNFAGAADGFEAYYRFIREDGVCLVTIDSGPLHIARKLGLPTVSVWGPTNPLHYLNVRTQERERHLTCYLGARCSPCVHRHEILPCGGDNFCMKDLSAEMIIDKVQTLLRHLAVAQPV
jgi:ADP-heptose:LPS heptosyltransferase